MSTVTALNQTIPTPAYNETQKRKTHMKKATSYKKEEKNARAVVRAKAWLKAAGVPAVSSSVGGCDLTVKTKTGRSLEIKVGISYDDPKPAAEHLFILACELVSKHTATAHKAFHMITIAAGYGTPLPVNRGEEPKKKLHFDDNFELVSMRHKEFRRVPNPTEAELAQFQPVIKAAVSRFMYINKVICQRHGLEFSDLQTYAQVWTCNYLGLYMIENPTQCDNEKNLRKNLRQRFAEFAQMLVKKERNCLPDGHTAMIAQFGRPCDGKLKSRVGTTLSDGFEPETLTFAEAAEAELEAQVDGVEFDVEMVDHDLAVSPQQASDDEASEKKISDQKRRKMAQATLRDEFGKMDHEVLVETLEGAVLNSHICYDARKEAGRQLRLHREDCSVCLAKVQEELPG